jgi:enduracididine biosynthesis enzyme MppR
MVPPPPWHFAGDVLWIECRMEPAAVTAFLPPGLEAGDDPGAGAIAFYDWQWCTDSEDELRDPARAQFRECLIAIGCTLGGEPVVRVPYAWVDSPVPLVRGLIQGMPKLFGSIHLTRSFPVGRAGPRREPGGRFDAVASAGGRRIVTGSVTLARIADRPPPMAAHPLVHTRHFPAWQPGEAPLVELVRSTVREVEFSEVWQGEAELAFRDVADPEVATLAPVATGPGYLFSYAETLNPGWRV